MIKIIHTSDLHLDACFSSSGITPALALQDTLIAVSASLGAVTFNAGDRAEEVIRRADEKMYLNKKNPSRRHSHARQLFQDPAVEAEQRTIEVRAAIAV